MAHKWRFLRHPKTTQEKRINGRRGFIELDDYKIRVRAKRNMKNLPDAWDDIFRGDWNERGWKRLRDTQYHVISWRPPLRVVYGEPPRNLDCPRRVRKDRC